MVALSPPPYTLLAHQFADPPNEFSNGAQRVSRKSGRVGRLQDGGGYCGKYEQREKIAQSIRIGKGKRNKIVVSSRKFPRFLRTFLCGQSKLDSEKV